VKKVRAEIHLGSIRNNAKAWKTVTKTKLCAVVKADAYGHGAEEVVCALSGVADAFAVAILDEAVSIKTAACGKDILIFTPPLDEKQVLRAAKDGFVLSVPDLWTAKLVAHTCERENARARVHLKVNTGMNRYGMGLSELGKCCKLFLNNPLVDVDGVYSHIYAETLSTANRQREDFMKAVGVCRKYFPNAAAHLSATYGATLGKNFALDMVRIGIGLYGYLPDGANKRNAPVLKKGMTVYASVAASRKYTRGGAGYGERANVNERTKRLYVVRAGYADGFLRKAQNGAVGEEDNVNNACMDVTLRTGNCRRGTEIALLTDADETAKKTGTISYEVLCAATRRAERIYDYE